MQVRFLPGLLYKIKHTYYTPISTGLIARYPASMLSCSELICELIKKYLIDRIRLTLSRLGLYNSHFPQFQSADK